MKAEEKTVAFMFFSVVMQFAYSLGKKQKQQQQQQKQNLGAEEGGGEGQKKRDGRAKF